ncbi:MAG: cytochrome bc complex cytochrome b subunit [Caldilineae bacterium]|nr:cytochrome bc complex cytochrome b subunit [Anaerolineae bacterium]MCB0255294.1 cytochrome bc complex cytochrome b subunit [Anaerolineae bacterium]MCB9154150.1 cytochrome bc complex cytochrome b subunit [Caldilineae bacterium]
MGVINNVAREIRTEGVISWLLRQLDVLITKLTTGLNWNDLRGLARGDDPRRPNPRLTVHSESFWFHIKPSYYHQSVTKLTHTFRLGLLSTYFFFIELVTGIFLMIYYAPTPQRAYGDMLNILTNVPFGELIRDVHRLTAEGMVIVVFLHMVRTFLTGSYKKPRQFTWLTGVVLLLATLFLSFSGYLLPWDQLAYWAVTIGGSMIDKAPPPVLGKTTQLILLGAPAIGPAGLLRFYLLHVLFVPLLVIFVFFIHYYKVVRVGISLPSSEEEIGQDTAKRVPADRRRYYLPDVFTDEMLLLALITFILLALIVLNVYPGAPLEHHANPNKTPLHTKAPWYFLWIQGLLKLGDPTIMGVVVPTIVFGFLFIMPYIDFNPSRRAKDRRFALSAWMLALAVFVILTWMGTPFFKVASPPAEEVVQLMLPEEEAGPVRETPWAELQLGEWDTRVDVPGDPDSVANPVMQGLMEEMAQHIVQEDVKAYEKGLDEGLPNGYGKMIIEEWQDGLKKITMRIFWQPEGVDEQTFEKTFFIHEEAGYGE